jgi:hypothetical protein
MAKTRGLLRNSNISLVKIEVIKQEIINEKDNPVLASSIDGYGYSFIFKKELNQKTGAGIIEFCADIVPILKNAENTTAKGEFIIKYTFLIPEVKEYIISDEKGVLTMNSDVDSWLTNVTYDTSRGILYNKVRGSFLENALLPTVKISHEVFEQEEEKKDQSASKVVSKRKKV